MEIIIPLPQCSIVNSYKGLMGYLKQLELAVHYAQKAVENADRTGIEITDDCCVTYELPSLEESINRDLKSEKINTILAKDVLESFIENHYDELQEIDLKINLK